MVVASSFLLLAILASTRQGYCNDSKRFDQLYEEGLEAYRNEEWTQASQLFQQAIDGYNQGKAGLLKCVRKCRGDRATENPLFSRNGELAETELQLVHVSHCVHRCRESGFAGEGVAADVIDTFESRLPYNFLQFSLYKQERLEDACRNFITYHLFNPEGHKVDDNWKYFNQLKLDDSAYIPMESLPYKVLYIEGIDLYTEQKWAGAAEKFQASLNDFYIKLDECYVMCEAYSDVNDIDGYEYHQSVSRLFMSTLKCRTQCVDKLDFFRLNTDDNILSSYFQYLQYTYYKLGRTSDALTSFAALVKISPNVSIVNNSRGFYQSFAPESTWALNRSDATVIEKLLEDRALLQLFEEVSGNDVLGDQKKKDEDATLLQQDFLDHPVGMVTPKVIQTDDDLLGINRVVFDNVITDRQCQDLIDLAQLATEGNGYPSKSPHTVHEKFEGLTVVGAVEAVVSGNTSYDTVQLYLSSADQSRALVEQHFNLNSTLYFSFTHLVCRTAIPEGQEFRNDLSHPVHADNCILNTATGECNKVEPAYTWRDYSAILYLNDQFDGGKFFFAHGTKDLSPQTYVSPKCGRLVGFSAGKENMHGVTPVTSGKRCAVALWFTLDPNYKEQQYDDAQKTLVKYKKT